MKSTREHNAPILWIAIRKLHKTAYVGQLKTPELRYLNYCYWYEIKWIHTSFSSEETWWCLLLLCSCSSCLKSQLVSVSVSAAEPGPDELSKDEKEQVHTSSLSTKRKMKISYERKFPLAGLLFPLVVISHETFKSLDKSWNFSRLESLTKGQLI